MAAAATMQPTRKPINRRRELFNRPRCASIKGARPERRLASSRLSAARPPGRAKAEALAAAPVARQTGRVAQCPLTDYQ
jgi:hypothetical protein